MKLIKLSALIVSIAAFVFLGACGGDEPETPPTNEEKLGITWVISDTGDPTIDGTGFSITFNISAEGEPTNYTVNSGLLTGGQRPNYAATGNSGTWTVNSSATQVIFDEGDEQSTVSVSNLTETTLTLTWSVPIDIDKNEPTYTYQLTPQ